MGFFVVVVILLYVDTFWELKSKGAREKGIFQLSFDPILRLNGKLSLIRFSLYYEILTKNSRNTRNYTEFLTARLVTEGGSWPNSCLLGHIFNHAASRARDYQGKRMNPPYRSSNKDNPCCVIFRRGTQFFRGLSRNCLRRNGGDVIVDVLISFHCTLSRVFVRPGFRSFCACLAVHYRGVYSVLKSSIKRTLAATARSTMAV